MVMDFAQDRSAMFQDEIKSAHFAKQQMTIHPIVVYHRYPESEELQRRSLVFLSDDTQHDYHAVQHFLDIAVEHLLQKLGKPPCFLLFSDGCPSQYKGKGSFADLSLSAIPTERHYYGSEHGKGEGDGEVG